LAIFRPEHSGTENSKGALRVWNRKFLFLLCMVLFWYVKKFDFKEYLSLDLAALINLVLFANSKFTKNDGIITFRTYLCLDHFYTQTVSFVTPKIMPNTVYSLHKIILDRNHQSRFNNFQDIRNIDQRKSLHQFSEHFSAMWSHFDSETEMSIPELSR